MKVYIISNDLKDIDLKVTDSFKAILDEKNIEYKVNIIHQINDYNIKSYTDVSDIDDDTDVVFVIGGDGTLIQAARDISKADIPIIGINMGHLGFLSEIEPGNLRESLEMIINGDYKLENRIMLSGNVYRGNEVVYKDIALNDVVISRADSLKVIDFDIYVDGEYLNHYTADGVIVTTPTGSTAYNLSAGGPILEPGAKIMAITPICSHTLSNRSVVLSADSVVEVKVKEGRHEDDSNTTVYFDGGGIYSLRKGDVLRVSLSEKSTKFLKLNKMSFIEILHKKMT